MITSFNRVEGKEAGSFHIVPYWNRGDMALSMVLTEDHEKLNDPLNAYPLGPCLTNFPAVEHRSLGTHVSRWKWDAFRPHVPRDGFDGTLPKLASRLHHV